MVTVDFIWFHKILINILLSTIRSYNGIKIRYPNINNPSPQCCQIFHIAGAIKSNLIFYKLEATEMTKCFD
ncbi:hypothetical protein BpHYR1_031225 [Brachionus plicatilis]|uniref:Uncharacterized protein n=1 Tax=Brachionus plicatilis TaxID=10195 RepID=A0A3M7PUY8_BRAPC|nr:hypothetical protein BpHYR1_031225 [Brachionus plicatilis]